MPPSLLADSRHPLKPIGPAVAVYVWPYALRLIHWGLVISIGVLSVTGYYLFDPVPAGSFGLFRTGWFRFLHEAFAMLLAALVLLRLCYFFIGNRWTRWRAYVPFRREQWAEMRQMLRFYLFLRPTPISKIGHNGMAALSYLGIYALLLAEIASGLAMYNWLRHSSFLGFFVGWIPRMVNLQSLRLIHFLLMFVFIAFGILHVHLCMLISRVEKRGLMDSIFIGYKLIPADELEQEERRAAAENT